MTSSQGQPPVPRTILGGVLMGLANLVPGVSGGTLILAVGLYDRFVGSIARVTRLKHARDDLKFLGLLGLSAVLSILLVSRYVVDFVQEDTWVAYSLFVGLSLGGVPALWREIPQPKVKEVVASLAGVGLLVALSFFSGESGLGADAWVLVIIGAVATSSMVLPGISGSYILILCGLYTTVVSRMGFDALIEDFGGSLEVLLPFGVGAVLGVAIVSNAMRSALERGPRITHAVLLGLLVGSVYGLWPFQASEHPFLVDDDQRAAVVELVNGESVTVVNERYDLHLTAEVAENLKQDHVGQTVDGIERMSRQYSYFSPTTTQIVSAIGLVLLGFLFTSRLSRREEADGAQA